MSLGDAVLYETLDDGIVEIRAIALNQIRASFLITQVAPRLGLAGGLIDEDPSNLSFSEADRVRISDSIQRVKEALTKSETFKSEQLELIDRKLDEIKSASERLGRKDWINYVAGTVTTLCMSAAFAPEQAKAIFKSLEAAFSWLLNQPPVF